MNSFKLVFNQQQLQVLNDALVNIPFKVAAPLIQHINAQIQQQFDANVDSQDRPSGQTTPPDIFTGD
jgi:hypothetical protein